MARDSLRTSNIFRKNTKGNTSVLFVVLATPIIAAVAGAIDFGHAVNVKGKMQNALDAAATAVCTAGNKDPQEVLRDRLAQSIGEFGLNLMDPPENPDDPPATPSGSEAMVLNTGFDTSTGALSPSLSTNMPTSMLGIVGMPEISLDVTSSIQCGAMRLELSLMLDVTGSMGSTVNGSTKLNSLKTAAHDVFDIFERNMMYGSTRIALVPFSEAVNVGPILAPIVRGTVPSSKTFQRNNGAWRTWDVTTCVTARTGIDAYTDEAPGSSTFLNPMYKSSSCKPQQEIVPLTNNTAQLRTIVDQFYASGATAGHLGTAWSWYLISEKWASLFPLENQPEPVNEEELIKATILMTDGVYNRQYCEGVRDNYINCNSPNGSSLLQAAELCDNMKNDGVVVYAVGFGLDPNSSTAQNLKNCASDETKWFFPYDGTELRAAFQSIGRSLAAGQAGQAVISQ